MAPHKRFSAARERLPGRAQNVSAAECPGRCIKTVMATRANSGASREGGAGEKEGHFTLAASPLPLRFQPPRQVAWRVVHNCDITFFLNEMILAILLRFRIAGRF